MSKSYMLVYTSLTRLILLALGNKKSIFAKYEILQKDYRIKNFKSLPLISFIAMWIPRPIHRRKRVKRQRVEHDARWKRKKTRKYEKKVWGWESLRYFFTFTSLNKHETSYFFCVVVYFIVLVHKHFSECLSAV